MKTEIHHAHALQRAAKDALLVQSACNLSGVVRSWATITEILWEEARRQNAGTAFVNTHPICQLFAFQAAYLAWGTEPHCDVYSAAYTACKRLAEEEA